MPRLDVLPPGQEQFRVALAHKEGSTGNHRVSKPDSILFQLNDCVGLEILDGSLQRQVFIKSALVDADASKGTYGCSSYLLSGQGLDEALKLSAGSFSVPDSRVT